MPMSADPFTRARIDTLIDQFRSRGVRMLALDVAAALSDAGLGPDAADILAEAVLARIGERVQPADAPPLRVRGRVSGALE
jgi:hypothetical protein